MASSTRQRLEEGPICDPVFVRHYWRLARQPSRAGAHWVAAKMRKLGVPPTACVLDVGCGPGWLARFLADYFPAMRFVGLDASEAMVRQACQTTKGGAPSASVRFVVGDGCRLPFPSARFDLVVSGATLHHVGDPVAFFDEIDRVLTRGGNVIVSDLNRSVPRLFWPLVRLADWIERRLRPPAARQLAEGFVSSYEAAYSPDEIRAFLRQSKLGRRVCHYPRLLQQWIQTPPRGNGRTPDVHPLEQRVKHDGV